MVVMCNITVEVNTTDSLPEFMNYLNEVPCASLVALVTFMEIKGYEIPLKSDEQKELMGKITIQVVISWDVIIGKVK